MPKVRSLHFYFSFLILGSSMLLGQSKQGAPKILASSNVVRTGEAQGQLLERYVKLPLSFEANRGQSDARVNFLSRGSGYSLFLTNDTAIFSFRATKAKANIDGPQVRPKPAELAKAGAVLRMKLVKANSSAKVTGEDELPGKTNYFIGNDPREWTTNVANYAKVRYEGVYSGIDLVYHGNQRQLEYDFVVKPGANPSQIEMEFNGATKMRQEHNGDLRLETEQGEIRWKKPIAYQEKDGARKFVNVRFLRLRGHTIGFRLGAYDQSRALTIDPVVGFIGFTGYSTFLGGTISDDSGYAIAVDSAGNAYVTGNARSPDFPTTERAFQPTYNGDSGHYYGEAFVTKVNPSGTALVYSTFLGGSDWTYGQGIAVDGMGNAYVTGYTQATNFPTYNAYQLSGGAFVTKLNPSGSELVYSTYITGAVIGRAIAVTSSGNAYVTGQVNSPYSSSLPSFTATSQFLGSPANVTFDNVDAFVTEFDPAGAMVYSVEFGGGGYDAGRGIVVDRQGNAIVAGVTQSADFPTTNAFQASFAGDTYNDGGGDDAFVTKLNASGTALLYSTYLGGSGGDQANGIAVDTSDNVYVIGNTQSPDFPTRNAFQPKIGGAELPYGAYPANAFITKLDSSGRPVYSTFFDISTGDGIAVDAFGDAFLVGLSEVSELNSSGSALVYSAGLGGISEPGSGIAVDAAGYAYVAGTTFDPNFPTTANSVQPKCLQCGNNPINSYGSNAFVTKLAPASLLIGGFPQQPLTRDGNGNFVVELTITNRGNISIDSVQVTVAGTTLGDAGLLAAPLPVINLAAGKSAQVVLKFPATAALLGVSIAPLEIAGTYAVSSLIPGISVASETGGNWSLSFPSVFLVLGVPPPFPLPWRPR